LNRHVPDPSPYPQRTTNRNMVLVMALLMELAMSRGM
jgi:hypothetical protein